MSTQSPEAVFQTTLEIIYQKFLPSQHPFFSKLALFLKENRCSVAFLGELYFRYQAACHSTRVMAYFLPYLDTPELRQRKLKILADDDAIETRETHHSQLRQVFENIGVDRIVADQVFGRLTPLRSLLDPTTADFVILVETLYPQSLGAWCIIEGFADNWMRALMHSLAIRYPSIQTFAYFADCFSQGVETRHAEESIQLTKQILATSPELLQKTLEDAQRMAEGLDRFWTGLEHLLEGGDSATLYSCAAFSRDSAVLSILH